MSSILACLGFVVAVVATSTSPASAQQSSLTFNGSNQYVTFGRAAGLTQLGAKSFTLECWFRREGTGTAATTGSGGLIPALPLIAKGGPQADGGTYDMNYYLGISMADTANPRIAADFEDLNNGLNHPITGTTKILYGRWYHAAVTYDTSGTWNLYLNGVLEVTGSVSGTLAVRTPRFDSIQHASLATTRDTSGAATSSVGYFLGKIDEPRIWNVARTQAQIQGSMNSELTSGTGLIGRWGLNEGTGTTAANSIVLSPVTPGTLTNSPTWTAASVFAVPTAPTALSVTYVSATQNQLAWTDNSSNELSFEIERSTTGSGGTYTLLTTVGQNVTSYADNAAPVGPACCYRVRAVNPGGASGYAGPTCATLPLPPADPTSLVATVVSNTQVSLTWTDVATTETSYELERSTTGIGGSYALLTSLPANATSYTNTGLTAASEYCYRVRAVNANGPSGYAGPACGTTAATGALDLGSASAYVSFGNPAALKLSQFTLEMWMRRDGAGTGANTGSGGITDAIPLVAKGMADGEVSSKDVNYLFGIQGSTGLLCADFEEDTTGTTKSLNHPIFGSTAIPADGAWRHVAVTYDGTWKLYLNGVLDGQLVVNKPPGFSSDVAVALGRALILSGTPSGNFDGAMDEVRIWNLARTQAQIQAAANSQITTPTTGLVARWALDEGGGSTVNGSAGTTINGTITGSGNTWILPAPFNMVLPTPPLAPGALNASAPTPTQVHLAWTDNSADETSFELQRSTAGAGGPFTLLATLAANTASYDDNTVTAGNPYCYQVRAVNNSGASSYTAVACATPIAPPTAPTALTASAPTSAQVHVAWTDNSADETSFELQRSTTGSGGPFTLLTSLAANTTSYDDNAVSASTQYCYQVRAVNGAFTSSWTVAACATTAAAGNSCLDFVGRDAGVNAYVNLGNLAALHLPAFTVEAWIRRDSVGVGNTTGANGVDSAVPIMAKGMAEVESADADYNYFLGIQVSTGFLCADFEESQAGTTPGSNHPVIGTTPIPADSAWHHVAATYDGTTWNLYLDGFLNGQLAVGQPCNTAGISPASIGSALKLDGSPLGFFHGRIDEARVWNSARTQSQIQGTINSQLATATPGLVARWGLNEGSGTSVGESVGGVGGTIVNTFYSWQPGAPFNWTAVPAPADPTNLTVTTCSQVHVDLAWTDNSGNETGFQVERGASSGGPFTLLATTAANVTSYSDFAVSVSTQYCYRVRAVLGATPSSYAGPGCAMTPAIGSNALDLGGTNAYANFGNPSALNLSSFTLEMWVRRDGAGTGTNTGTGGILDAVPLLAKGRADAETQAADINYFFGIRQSTGVLCADFEEAQTGTSPGLNHPIQGVTVIPIGTWHHVAMTYDGSSQKLYLDGVLDASFDVGQPANNANSVAVSLGTALTTAGVAAGFFDGVVDEVRIWSVAREQSQIVSTASSQITTPQAGLVARWSMDEGTGATVGGSAGTSIPGTLAGTYGWGCGADAAPFGLTFNSPPLAPVLVSPSSGATGVPTSPSLNVAVTDPDGDPVTVTYYGRATTGTPGPDFTLIGLPDTQYYTGQLNGGSNAMFKAQTNWILSNLVSRNIAYAVQLGDCTEHGNNGRNPIEWVRADSVMKIIENPVTTGMPAGLPYGICAGNHDQTPIGIDSPDTTTLFYNQYFGAARFNGRAYYGGHYGSNNDNWYDLFSAGGMDFIAIGLEYDTSPDAAVLAWADQLLTTHSSRRAIVSSHFIVNTGNPAGYGPQGQAIYDALKGHSNLFMMLCGHVPGEGRRQDTFNGNTVHTLLSDYQSRSGGGSGLLRIMEFSPANNVIRVRTYSPWLNTYEADADSSSQFTLPYVMTSASPFAVIGSVTVPSGTTASLPWPGRALNSGYEWYAELTDGTGTQTGPVWGFTTAAQVSYTISATAGTGGAIAPTGSTSVLQGASQTFTITPTSGYSISDVLVDGATQGAITSYTFSNVQANHTISAAFILTPAIDAVAAAVPPGTVISGAHTCVDVPVTFTRTDATPARAYSVRVRLGGGLAACGAKFVKGTYLTAVAPSTFQVIDNLDGTFDVDEAILGATCGATGSGTLFTVRVGSSTAMGTGTIAIENVLVRDCGNAPLPGSPGATASVAIDNTPPAAPSVLTAQQVTLGNDTDGTTKIAIAYTAAVEAGGHVEVWRKGYGNYPEYDDGGSPGAVPAMPVGYPPSGWTQTAVTASGQADEPATRDAWYYVAYAVDAAGNATASPMAGGALNYALGDVHNGSGDCAGDNHVTTSDLTFFGAHYGASLGVADPLGCLDFGPTATGYVDSRPATDNWIDFEDLILFAINYGLVSQPSASSRPAVRAGGGGNWLQVSVEDPPAAGGTLTATLAFSGGGDVQALSARLDYDAAVVEPVSVERGALLLQQSGPAQVFTPRPGMVDVAVLGRGQGLTGTGELARVSFRRKAAGDPGIVVGTVRARDQGNRPVALDPRVAQPMPARLELAPSYPNPFTHATTVVFGMPRAGTAKLQVFDIQGRAVRHLADGAVGAGWQRVAWDGHDDAGNAVQPGAYVIRLAVDGRVISKSVRLVR